MNQEQKSKMLEKFKNAGKAAQKRKVKTYVLTVSEKFPTYHKKSGCLTNFIFQIKNNHKIHTMRSNYDLWAKRFEKINKGEAILSVRTWYGIPYKSKQLEIFKYDNTHKIGLQKLEDPSCFVFAPIDGKEISWETVAKNDGLLFDDFCDWFKFRSDKPMAIIHFTDFRYC